MNHHSCRPRRLRQHAAMRNWVAETELSAQDLVFPIFIRSGDNCRVPITAMPGHFQWSVDQLATIIDSVVAAGIPAVLLFGLPAYKDVVGSAALQSDGVVQSAIRWIKSHYPQLIVIADCCFCEYTDHGHCGVLTSDRWGQPTMDNDGTLPLLAQQACSLAAAGADVIAPSGMVDGMVAVIRRALDDEGYSAVTVLSYAVKYASCFYDPFREAAEGAAQQGDRKGYQMNPANGAEALLEASLDIQQGADMIMVKPAGHYLDVVYRVKQAHPSCPLGAYQVSGEFAMIVAAAEAGWVDRRAAVLESVLSMKRAGADFIVTYFALEVAACLK